MSPKFISKIRPEDTQVKPTKPSTDGKPAIYAQCIVCRKPVVMVDPHEEDLRGKTAYVGKCPDCGGRVAQFKETIEYLAAAKKNCPKCQSELMAVDEKCKYCGFDYKKDKVKKR